ncbi:MAG: zinc ribbon domain-containing protein, partial [Nitrososphaeria archaeon]
GIAKLKTLLGRHKNTYKIDRYYASTQECSNCHKLNKIPLSQRVYVCKYCGLTIGRDLNSGIDNDAKGYRDAIALGYPPLMPVDDETTTVMLEYLKGIPHVVVSLIDEAGSASFSWA